MMKNKKKLYPGISIAIVFCIAVILFYINNKEKREVAKNILPVSLIPSLETKDVEKNVQRIKTVESSEENTLSATVLAGESIVKLPFIIGASFYDALMQAKNEGQITFSGKNYLGLGFFVTDIGSLHSGSGKNLLYYINGKQASVGVSSYLLKDGDIIEWKLE